MRTIRPYDPVGDEPQVYRLWARTLGQQWPVPQTLFHHVTVGTDTYRPGDHLIAEVAGQVIGFVGIQVTHIPDEPSPRGEVMVILVAPTHQRQGVGRTLLEQALASLRHRGVARVQLGGSAATYFWPGVPANLPEAWSFFQACGWSTTESSFDLIRDLRGYATPPDFMARLQPHGIRIEMAKPTDRPAVLAFERRHFPHWLSEFERPFQHGDDTDILMAIDAQGTIIGTALILDPRSQWRHPGFVWADLLGASTGGVGALGVAKAWRGRGIGRALAAQATEILHDRDLATSYIGWTWLVDWYAQLGYRIWQRYRVSWKQTAQDEG